jgi:hypothetical protein
MWDTLIKKMLTSRKFVVMAVGLIIKLISPLAAKWGIDISGLDQALNEWMPAIIAWLIGQSAVDAVKENKLPEPPPLP